MTKELKIRIGKIYFRLEGVIETDKKVIDISIKELGKLIYKKPQIVSSKILEKEK